ncbi:MAG: hypothetical protein U5N85_21915 [Arcicella sp.]|nr:hypothetical protein [Arcicella sp.]
MENKIRKVHSTTRQNSKTETWKKIYARDEIEDRPAKNRQGFSEGSGTVLNVPVPHDSLHMPTLNPRYAFHKEECPNN